MREHLLDGDEPPVRPGAQQYPAHPTLPEHTDDLERPHVRRAARP
ncbi:hypothetical protein [Streptomyces sp. NPDC005533]